MMLAEQGYRPYAVSLWTASKVPLNIVRNELRSDAAYGRGSPFPDFAFSFEQCTMCSQAKQTAALFMEEFCGNLPLGEKRAKHRG